ncbi:hypothetical protein U1Q18_014729 [Sarracenia purpurea var. burkii]
MIPFTKKFKEKESGRAENQAKTLGGDAFGGAGGQGWRAGGRSWRRCPLFLPSPVFDSISPVFSHCRRRQPPMVARRWAAVVGVEVAGGGGRFSLFLPLLLLRWLISLSLFLLAEKVSAGSFAKTRDNCL